MPEAALPRTDMRPVRATGLLRAALRQLTVPPGAEPDTATAELRGRILLSLAYTESEQGHLELGRRLLRRGGAVAAGAVQAPRVEPARPALHAYRTGRRGDSAVRPGARRAPRADRRGGRRAGAAQPRQPAAGPGAAPAGPIRPAALRRESRPGSACRGSCPSRSTTWATSTTSPVTSPGHCAPTGRSPNSTRP